MTEILGHDVNGEALRAGEQVRYIGEPDDDMPQLIGATIVVTAYWDRHPKWGDRLDTDEPDGYGETCIVPANECRKLQSGRDVFEKARDRALSQGNPDTQRTEPTTTERAQAWISGQPWVEPSR